MTEPVSHARSGADGDVRPTEPAIRVRGLTKAYTRRVGDDGERALKGVDLDVRAGEFLVLLGPSGCGKTTLLRCIAGLEKPTGGTITIDGQPIFDGTRRLDVSPERRPVSMIFQSYALWPHMTAYRNVAFPLACIGVRGRAARDRVEEVLDKVGIAHLAQRYPGQMSGGQQQRLALARALVVDKRVVLFDEPLSNVDAQVREKLRIELIRMQRSLGFTAIYVTHDQGEAMELADRIAVMAQGEIAQLDEPSAMYTNPATLHVARFLGQSNEIEATVTGYDAAGRQVDATSPLGPVRATWSGTGPDPAAGEAVVVFGRPLDFTLAPGGATGPAVANRWAGTVEAVRFVGLYTESVVRVGDVRLRSWALAGAGAPGAAREGTDVEVAASDLRAMREG